MTNPEFRRNLWLSFSMHRLIAMPALLGLVFLTVALLDSAARVQSLYYTALVLFILAVWIWGGMNASAAIVDELRDKTWDQQRMSALVPWTMTWGKLLGATSFNWYGGLICLLVLVFSGIAAHRPGWILELLILIATAILIHALAIGLNLHTGRLEMDVLQRRGVGSMGLLFAFLALQGFMATRGFADSSAPMIWWGMAIGKKIFLLASALLFMACAVFAAWRLMCSALQVRTLPWALPLFVIILTVYCTGFADKKWIGLWFSLAGCFIATVFSYATLLTEPNGLLVWNKLRLRLRAGDWRGLLADLPLWPTVFLLALLFALAAMLIWPADVSRPGSATPLALVLLLLRDVGIVLFFSFAPKARRPATIAVLYIAVLDALLPFFFQTLGLRPVAYFFSPYFYLLSGHAYGSGGTDLLIAGIHAAFALGLVAWRFNKTRRQTG